MNQRRRSNPHHRQHEQQPSFSGYSGFSQHNDRRIPSLIPISKSVMNGTTNNGNQKNTRNGMSQSISPQLTNGKKNVFSFKKKPTTVSSNHNSKICNYIQTYLLYFSTFKTVL